MNEFYGFLDVSGVSRKLQKTFRRLKLHTQLGFFNPKFEIQQSNPRMIWDEKFRTTVNSKERIYFPIICNYYASLTFSKNQMIVTEYIISILVPIEVFLIVHCSFFLLVGLSESFVIVASMTESFWNPIFFLLKYLQLIS